VFAVLLRVVVLDVVNLARISDRGAQVVIAFHSPW